MSFEETISGYNVPAKRSKADAWNMLEARIPDEKAGVKRSVISLNWFIGFASAAAVVFAILYLGMFRTGKYSPEISSGIASVETVNMPDGSNVQLNYNSNIKYHVNKFSGERNVILNGDALFDVEKGGKFLVNFDGGTVSVKGTKFYVSAYSPEMLQVDCTEGLVEVNLDETEYQLQKNQGIKFYNGKVTGPYYISENEVNDRLNGIFYWKVISLPELTDLIGYRFGYDIQLDNTLQARNFSGKLELNNIDDGLMIISVAMDFNYSVNEDKKLIQINAN